MQNATFSFLYILIKIDHFMYTIEVEGEDENGKPKTFKAQLRKISKQTLSNILPFIGATGEQTNLLTAGEIIIRECIDHQNSDPEILTDEELLMSCALQAVGMIDLKKATLKKN